MLKKVIYLTLHNNISVCDNNCEYILYYCIFRSLSTFSSSLSSCQTPLSSAALTLKLETLPLKCMRCLQIHSQMLLNRLHYFQPLPLHHLRCNLLQFILFIPHPLLPLFISHFLSLILIHALHYHPLFADNLFNQHLIFHYHLKVNPCHQSSNANAIPITLCLSQDQLNIIILILHHFLLHSSNRPFMPLLFSLLMKPNHSHPPFNFLKSHIITLLHSPLNFLNLLLLSLPPLLILLSHYHANIIAIIPLLLKHHLISLLQSFPLHLIVIDHTDYPPSLDLHLPL